MIGMAPLLTMKSTPMDMLQKKLLQLRIAIKLKHPILMMNMATVLPLQMQTVTVQNFLMTLTAIVSAEKMPLVILQNILMTVAEES